MLAVEKLKDLKCLPQQAEVRFDMRCEIFGMKPEMEDLLMFRGTLHRLAYTAQLSWLQYRECGVERTEITAGTERDRCGSAVRPPSGLRSANIHIGIEQTANAIGEALLFLKTCGPLDFRVLIRAVTAYSVAIDQGEIRRVDLVPRKYIRAQDMTRICRNGYGASKVRFELFACLSWLHAIVVAKRV